MIRRITALALAAALCLGGPWAFAEKETAGEAPEAEEELLPWSYEASQQEARDISDQCLYNERRGGPKHLLNDGAYNHVFDTGPQGGAHSVRVETAGEEKIGALYIQWAGDPVATAVQIPAGDGWETVATRDGDFFADYIPVPECTACRVIARDNPMTQLHLSEMRVLTAGKPAADIQVWEKAEGKMDMILIAGHPDDELIWFGGALPTYAGERGKRVLVICCAISAKLRRLELCDALWACGVRIHPIYLHRLDFSDTSLDKVLEVWHGKEEVAGQITGYFRQFRPDVLLLHDVNGEYGHGIHKAASWLGTTCAAQAADPEIWPESAKRFGTWDVKKIYVHLAEENQIRMDWKQPLAAFGGKTGLEAAQEALQMHKSQVAHGWKVQEGGEYDNALFGLVHSTVGPDTEKKDFFEHIPE